MKRKVQPTRKIKRNTSKVGEFLEWKLSTLTTTGKKIDLDKTGLELTENILYSPRNAGVIPETDIRTDPWYTSMKIMGKVTREDIKKREVKQVMGAIGDLADKGQKEAE